MALYKIELRKSAAKELRNLPKPYIRSITSAIADLATDPRPTGAIKLSGSNSFRIRIGTFRVIYEIHDDVLIVVVIKIGHRKDVYR